MFARPALRGTNDAVGGCELLDPGAPLCEHEVSDPVDHVVAVAALTDELFAVGDELAVMDR